MLLMMFITCNCFIISKYNPNNNRIIRSKKSSQTVTMMVGIPKGNLKGKENESQLQQQKQQRQQQKLMYFQCGLLVLVIVITSYLGFMQQNQMTAVDKLTVMQQNQIVRLDVIDTKLNTIFGGAAVALGLLTFAGSITTSIKNSQDIALNNFKLREIQSQTDNDKSNIQSSKKD
jgi:hypothetical protein